MSEIVENLDTEEKKITEGCSLVTDIYAEESSEDTEQLAQSFLNDWELQAMLINDEKLRENHES